MGQEPGTERASVTETPTPEELRADIEATRHELGDTVAALAEKADVKGQAKQKVEDVKDRAASKVGDVKQSISDTGEGLKGKAKAASPDAVASAARQASQRARENPLPLAMAGAFLAGLLVGRRRGR